MPKAPKTNEFRPSWSDDQKAFVKDSYMDEWYALVETDASPAEEQEFKDKVVLACIGTADKKKPTHVLFSPLTQEEPGLAHPKAFDGWRKVMLFVF
jgi:hypothetical protein